MVKRSLTIFFFIINTFCFEFGEKKNSGVGVDDNGLGQIRLIATSFNFKRNDIGITITVQTTD